MSMQMGIPSAKPEEDSSIEFDRKKMPSYYFKSSVNQSRN